MDSILTVVTSNQNKLKEIVNILGTNHPFLIKNKCLDIVEVQGDIDFVITKKVESAAFLVKGPIIIDDSYFNCNALNGLPGPYIKYFIDKLGPDGLYRLLSGWDDKSSVAGCAIGFTEGPKKEIHIFHGKLKGKVVEPRGEYGFGFDSCFQPDEYNQTLGEMNPVMKNSMSHRYLALKQLKEYLESRYAKNKQFYS